jgi:hypothetical protein
VKLEHAERIVAAANDLGLDVSLHEDYSGRGMYGRKTAGVSGKLGAILQSVAQAALELADFNDYDTTQDFVKDMDVASDSLGRDTIVY